MKTFLNITPTSENSKMIHFFCGSYGDNVPELMKFLEDGWCIYTILKDSTVGSVGQESSTTDKNQPVLSFTLILIKTDKYQQKILKFAKGGSEYDCRNLTTQDRIKKDILSDKDNLNERYLEFLNEGYLPVGSIIEGDNHQVGWYPLFIQLVLFQKELNTDNFKHEIISQ